MGQNRSVGGAQHVISDKCSFYHTAVLCIRTTGSSSNYGLNQSLNFTCDDPHSNFTLSCAINKKRLGSNCTLILNQEKFRDLGNPFPEYGSFRRDLTPARAVFYRSTYCSIVKLARASATLCSLAEKSGQLSSLSLPNCWVCCYCLLLLEYSSKAHRVQVN